jgi:hypothetical protein
LGKTFTGLIVKISKHYEAEHSVDHVVAWDIGIGKTICYINPVPLIICPFLALIIAYKRIQESLRKPFSNSGLRKFKAQY